MTQLQTVQAGANALVVVNENMDALSAVAVLGRRAEGSFALTWGYYGGIYHGVTVEDGDVALTDDAVNYIVVQRASGAVSASTATTNWADTDTYARLYAVTTLDGVVSSYVDHRMDTGGALAGEPSSGGGDSGAQVTPLMPYGGANFNGASYLDTNPLTGVADGKKGTIVAIVRFNGAAAADERIFASTSNRFTLSRSATGQFLLRGQNSGATLVLNAVFGGHSAAGVYKIVASWDLSIGAAHLYVNDVPTPSAPTTTDDNIDYTVTEYAVGATTVGGNLLNGDIYMLWFEPTAYIDFSQEANRRRVLDGAGVPVYMGARGQLLTGSPPLLFLAYDDTPNWYRNRGTAQSSSWTVNGTLSNATSSLNGQWAPLADVGRGTVVTAATYTVQRNDRRVIVNNGAACALTLLDPAQNQGRELYVLQTGGAFAVTSASANVVPLAGGAAASAILPAIDGAWAMMVARGTSWEIVASGGISDVVGPASSTDNALARFDGTGGKTLQGTGVTVTDNDEIHGFKGALNAQTGTTYTLQASDTGKIVELTNAAAITLTVPNSLPVGFECVLVQGGAGQVTISAAVGATVRNRQSHIKLAGQWAAGMLYVRTNAGGTAAEYVLGGDTSA